MTKVAIVTDTTACIPQEMVARYHIGVVPIELVFGDRVYRDGIDITPSDFYAMLRKAETIPTTAGSLPGPYLESFRSASAHAASILCITEPARLTGMYNSALVAKQMAEDTLPRVVIEVIDCTTAAAGLGLVALAAARAAAGGRDLAEVRHKAEETMSRVELYATLDTLHYLVKGGRVPQAAELVNSFLKIKPVFTLNHGDAHTVALPRSTRSAMNYLLKMMQQKVIRGKPLHVAVMHADAPGEAETLKARITSRFDCTEFYITEFTPVMGVHTGPGLFGVAFYNED